MNLRYLLTGHTELSDVELTKKIEESKETFLGKLVENQKALTLTLILSGLLLVSESFLFSVKYISNVENKRPVTLQVIDEVINYINYKPIQKDYDRVEKSYF